MQGTVPKGLCQILQHSAAKVFASCFESRTEWQSGKFKKKIVSFWEKSASLTLFESPFPFICVVKHTFTGLLETKPAAKYLPNGFC